MLTIVFSSVIDILGSFVNYTKKRVNHLWEKIFGKSFTMNLGFLNRTGIDVKCWFVEVKALTPQTQQPLLEAHATLLTLAAMCVLC